MVSAPSNTLALFRRASLERLIASVRFVPVVLTCNCPPTKTLICFMGECQNARAAERIAQPRRGENAEMQPGCAPGVGWRGSLAAAIWSLAHPIVSRFLQRHPGLCPLLESSKDGSRPYEQT